jgi:hypothetical protein
MSEARDGFRQTVIDLLCKLLEQSNLQDAETRLKFRLGEYLELTDAAPLDDQLRQAAR